MAISYGYIRHELYALWDFSYNCQPYDFGTIRDKLKELGDTCDGDVKQACLTLSNCVDNLTVSDAVLIERGIRFLIEVVDGHKNYIQFCCAANIVETAQCFIEDYESSSDDDNTLSIFGSDSDATHVYELTPPTSPTPLFPPPISPLASPQHIVGFEVETLGGTLLCIPESSSESDVGGLSPSGSDGEGPSHSALDWKKYKNYNTYG